MKKKCASSLPAWDSTLVVTDAMKLHYIKVPLVATGGPEGDIE